MKIEQDETGVRRQLRSLMNGEAVCPYEIKEQSICIDGDIGKILEDLKQ